LRDYLDDFWTLNDLVRKFATYPLGLTLTGTAMNMKIHNRGAYADQDSPLLRVLSILYLDTLPLNYLIFVLYVIVD
jgi:hypothetical protein